MPKKRSKTRNVIDPRQGTDLVFLAGLPRTTLKWILDTLRKDTSKKHLTFDGAPSAKDDFGELYNHANLENILEMIGARVSQNFSNSVPTPRRIFILYVPSKSEELLIEKLGIACYLEPLAASDAHPYPISNILWRHDKEESLNLVSRAIMRATEATNKLKNEITDRGRSALSLPSRNYYYPNRDSLIRDIYLSIARHEISPHQLYDTLKAMKMNSDRLAAKALKSTRSNHRVFRDHRGRLFPPVIDHAPNRYSESSSPGEFKTAYRNDDSDILKVLNQRYRFGVIARNGNLHYDVQYETPRTLHKEPMYCSNDGYVLVTGSHANVGVNDAIWAPDGNKETAGHHQIN